VLSSANSVISTDESRDWEYDWFLTSRCKKSFRPRTQLFSDAIGIVRHRTWDARSALVVKRARPVLAIICFNLGGKLPLNILIRSTAFSDRENDFQRCKMIQDKSRILPIGRRVSLTGIPISAIYLISAIHRHPKSIDDRINSDPNYVPKRAVDRKEFNVHLDETVKRFIVILHVWSHRIFFLRGQLSWTEREKCTEQRDGKDGKMHLPSSL